MLNISGSIKDTIALNGGKLTLQNNINIQSSSCFTSSGIIDLNDYTLLYQLASDSPVNLLDVSLTWSGNNGSILFSSDVTLTNTWTFQGICTINGNGNTVSLEPGGEILVDANSTLILKDIRLNEIGPNNIRCLDNTGKIVLDNAHWIQDEDYTFDKGSLDFKNDVVIGGQYRTFTYQSTQTSHVYYDTVLKLDANLTFSYAPTNGDQTLLSFDDYTSVLLLEGTTVYLNPGLKLTNGKLKIRKSPFIYIYDTSTERGAGGLTLGDEISGHDMHLRYLDNSILTIASGSLNYKNTILDAIEIWDNGYIHILSNASLNIFQDMYMEDGKVSFCTDSTYAYKTGKECKATITSFGTYNKVEF
jgi:hypothetical protein